MFRIWLFTPALLIHRQKQGSLVHKAPKFHTSFGSKMSPLNTHHKSTLKNNFSARPWLFCQGPLWSCNYAASSASTLKNDLQYRVHLATLIILMLIGSTVTCLFRCPGWTAKNTKELKIDVEPSHAITHRRMCCQRGCWLWAEWNWVLDVKAVALLAAFICSVLNTNGQNNRNTTIKIPLSFVCCFHLVLFWPSHLLKEKVTAIYY